MDTNSYGHIKTEIGVNPIKYNVAISSINSKGSLGELNLFVLNNLGYNPDIINEIDVSKGYYLLKGKNKKQILFIVTTGQGNTGISLQKNLTNGLTEYQKLLHQSNVWIPLMGTGAGNLHFVDSYDTTIGVLKKFKNINFTIAIPKSKKGEEFLSNFRVDNLEAKRIQEEIINEDRLDRFDIKETKKVNEKEHKKNYSFEKLKEILGNVNYFVAGHSWGGENDQMPRFIENNIWENGHDKNDTGAVNSAEKNDVIFMKSAFPKGKIGILRIKAIGVVIVNKKDGHNLIVNWYSPNNYIDIEGLSKYRRTFARVSDHDVNTILDNVFQEEPRLISIIKNLKIVKNKKADITDKNKKEEEVKPEIKTNTITIAGLTSDADSGEDHLDISKDVNAFAKVMAAKSFNPPLAIALLGKWGSGKSFFMRKLKKRIESLSSVNNNSKAYCGGIAHVHFNAWSYMDANLWAGIVTKIFEGLQEYISNDTKASINKRDIEKDLTKKLNIAQDELKNLEQKKESITDKIKTLESQKGEAEALLESKIDLIKNESIKNVLNKLDNEFKISQKVTETLSKNKSFNKSVETFSKIVPKAYWQNPTELYQQTKSIYAHIRTFFKGTTWKSNLTWIGLIGIIVLSIKGFLFLFTKYLTVFNFELSTTHWSLITVISSFIIRHVQTIKQLQPIVASFYKIKEDYELQKKDAIFKIQQAEKGLQLEIENHKNKIQTISQQIKTAKESKAEIEYRLKNTLTTEALFSFIEKRAVSKDYKKHLGIVSIIRKDFEILSELFSGHNNELEKSEDSKKFQKQFERPLERIILYIDDLDRCPNERVVEVLEAVNLLMAYPLFVVVVGVDPRWVKNALDEKYASQFKNDTSKKETIEPSGYLEKIFQIPFQLKSATDTSVKHMLKTLAETSAVKIKNTDFEGDEEVFELYENKIVDFKLEDNSKEIIEEPIEEEIIRETIESLKFSEIEIKLIESMSSILGTNPRALKRFVNIYRVIKAHEDFNYTDEKKEIELQTVMFLIALPIGKFRKIYRSFSEVIKSDNDKETLATFLLSHTFKSSYEELNENSNPELDNLKTELYTNLQNISHTLLSQKTADFKTHYTFIKRFTFNNL